jgi:nitric oxide reductase subunit B
MTYESQRIAYAYFFSALLLFGLQVAFGFLSLAKYLGPDPLIDALNFATSKEIHTNLLLVWLITGFMGAAYFIVPEESRVEIWSTRLGYLQLALWLTASSRSASTCSGSPRDESSSRCHCCSSSAWSSSC